MMLVEQHFSDRSAYPKDSDTSTSIDIVEWFAKNVGITNLDDPSVKVKTIIDDVNECELARHEAKKAREAKAKEEHEKAMLNLKNGTAVLRQKNERTKPAAKPKQLEIAKPAKQIATLATKPAKAIKSVVKKPRKPYYHKPSRAVPSLQMQAQERRKVLLAKLQAGEFLPMQPKQAKKGDFCLYRQQRAALKKIEKKSGLTIVRIKRIQDGKSFFAIDNFKRHQIEQKVSGNLDGDDRCNFIKAIASGELVLASDLTKGARVGISSTRILALNHGMNIYAAFSGRYVLGWILIDKAVTPEPILEAAYREFKRVAKDAGTTISGVLAVKGTQ